MVNINATTPQLKLVKEWMEAHSALDMDSVEPLMSKRFKFQSGGGTPAQTKAEYIQTHKGMVDVVEKAHAEIHEVNEEPGKVIIHTTGNCSTSDGNHHKYQTVCTFSLVEEDGKLKVLEVSDVPEPGHHKTFHAGIAKARA